MAVSNGKKGKRIKRENCLLNFLGWWGRVIEDGRGLAMLGK